tara:strand:- start:116 stop:1126 length:1011 start_codon:yes stop_codon:yes gene_type:complete
MNNDNIMNNDNKPICILSIDGGGIKGLVLVAILEEIEKRSKKSIRDIFNFIIGTSAGGIAAIHMAFTDNKYNSCKEYRKSLERVRNVFSQYNLFRVIRKGYGCPLEPTLEVSYLCNPSKTYCNILPPKPNKDTPHCCVLTSKRNYLGEWSPFLLRNYDNIRKLDLLEGSSDWCISDQLLATSAACTIFKPFEKNNEIYTDAGIICNNPTEFAINEIRSLYPNRPIKMIVSISSGHSKINNIENIDSMNLMYWIKTLVNLTINNSERIHNLIKNIYIPNYCNFDNIKTKYYRIDPIISDVEAKEYNIEKLNNMSNEVDKWIKDNNDIFDEICKNIKE